VQPACKPSPVQPHPDLRHASAHVIRRPSSPGSKAFLSKAPPRPRSARFAVALPRPGSSSAALRCLASPSTQLLAAWRFEEFHIHCSTRGAMLSCKFECRTVTATRQWSSVSACLRSYEPTTTLTLMLLLDLSAMFHLDLELISRLVDSIPVRNLSFSYFEFPSSKPLRSPPADSIVSAD